MGPLFLAAFFNRPISKKTRDSLLACGYKDKQLFVQYFHYFLDVLDVSEIRIAPIRPARTDNILTRIPSRAYNAIVFGGKWWLGKITHLDTPHTHSAFTHPLSPHCFLLPLSLSLFQQFKTRMGLHQRHKRDRKQSSLLYSNKWWGRWDTYSYIFLSDARISSL